MLSNLKSLCPKRSFIAIALSVGMGSVCITTNVYAIGDQAESYTFSQQSVADVKTILNGSKLYSLLLALRVQAPEIETAAYHAMVLAKLNKIAVNTAQISEAMRFPQRLHCHVSGELSKAFSNFEEPLPQKNLLHITPSEFHRLLGGFDMPQPEIKAMSSALLQQILESSGGAFDVSESVAIAMQALRSEAKSYVNQMPYELNRSTK